MVSEKKKVRFVPLLFDWVSEVSLLMPSLAHPPPPKKETEKYLADVHDGVAGKNLTHTIKVNTKFSTI